jgi:hypothetical protein
LPQPRFTACRTTPCAVIFFADHSGDYIGRICHYRECHARALCQAQHCGRRNHLNHDLHVVTLSREPIVAPLVELWPRVVDASACLLTLKNFCLPSWNSRIMRDSGRDKAKVPDLG